MCRFNVGIALLIDQTLPSKTLPPPCLRITCVQMNPPGHQVRRATLDDLQPLVALWQVARLPALELEKHFTDFQVVARTDGPLIGAIGLHVQGQHGKLYSEAFFHPEQEEEFRPQIWD